MFISSERIYFTLSGLKVKQTPSSWHIKVFSANRSVTDQAIFWFAESPHLDVSRVAHAVDGALCQIPRCLLLL